MDATKVFKTIGLASDCSMVPLNEAVIGDTHQPWIADFMNLTLNVK